MTKADRWIRRQQRRDAARARERAQLLMASATAWLDEGEQRVRFGPHPAHLPSPKPRERRVALWCVSATVSHTHGGWHSARQVPTFYLHPDVQGITSEKHAKSIARDVLETAGADVCFVRVEPVYEED